MIPADCDVRWAVLAGHLSPYMLRLWEAVAACPGQSVSILYRPGQMTPDFRHESNAHAANVSLTPVLRNPGQVVGQARSIVTEADVVVSLGHDGLHKLMGATIARALNRPLLYVADTNIVGVAGAVSESLASLGLHVAKRVFLGAVFEQSLTLGRSDELAHRLVGVKVCHRLPIYAVEFPDEVGNLPTDLEERIVSLPSPRLLCTARLVPEKNLVNLARVFSHYVASGGAGSLCFVGDGPLKEEIERELAALPASRYLVAGALKYEASRGLARRFDGTILPSTSEPWGIVVVESLGEGTPVLASDHVGSALSLRLASGAQHAVELCGTTPSELAEGLCRFVERLEDLKRVARERAPSIQAMFGVAPVAARLVNLGRDVIGKARRTSA